MAKLVKPRAHNIECLCVFAIKTCLNTPREYENLRYRPIHCNKNLLEQNLNPTVMNKRHSKAIAFRNRQIIFRRKDLCIWCTRIYLTIEYFISAFYLHIRVLILINLWVRFHVLHAKTGKLDKDNIVPWNI